jgi:hypothetical protein
MANLVERVLADVDKITGKTMIPTSWDLDPPIMVFKGRSVGGGA